MIVPEPLTIIISIPTGIIIAQCKILAWQEDVKEKNNNNNYYYLTGIDAS